MNKQKKEVFLKKNITMYAKKIRDVQSEQIDPFIELIGTELRELYPELIDKEDGVENWAYDIVNASSNSEVIETVDRIEQILEKEYEARYPTRMGNAQEKQKFTSVVASSFHNAAVEYEFTGDFSNCLIYYQKAFKLG